METKPKHTRIITKTPRPGEAGVADIVTESYFEELNGVEQQIQKSIKTTRQTLATDIIGCLREITNGETTELELRIVTDKATSLPCRIVKTWTIKKEYYGK